MCFLLSSNRAVVQTASGLFNMIQIISVATPWKDVRFLQASHYPQETGPSILYLCCIVQLPPFACSSIPLFAHLFCLLWHSICSLVGTKSFSPLVFSILAVSSGPFCTMSSVSNAAPLRLYFQFSINESGENAWTRTQGNPEYFFSKNLHFSDQQKVYIMLTKLRKHNESMKQLGSLLCRGGLEAQFYASIRSRDVASWKWRPLHPMGQGSSARTPQGKVITSFSS